MNWKQHLIKLEHDKKWDEAIVFMEGIVTKSPHDVDAYLSILYLLMNLLVEEDYNDDKHDYYESLSKKYFADSYSQFSNNPKYLFFVSRIAYMSEWYFDVTTDFVDGMIEKAVQLDPENSLYLWGHYMNADTGIDETKVAILNYAHFLLAHEESIRLQLQELGSLGEYVALLMFHWARDKSDCLAQ